MIMLMIIGHDDNHDRNTHIIVADPTEGFVLDRCEKVDGEKRCCSAGSVPR